jgi:excisionase family DNA binding protein
MPVDELLTARDVARLCHVRPVTVRNWIRSGGLTATRTPGGHYRIAPAALRTYLRARGLPVPTRLLSRSARRVLVVDDEPSTVDILVRALLLEAPPPEVATAGDGFVAGLQLATFRPDLLVLDLLMPQVNGFEVCRIVRSNPATAHIKILVVTAHGDHGNISRALAAGANDFCLKPVVLDQFRAKARALLDL